MRGKSAEAAIAVYDDEHHLPGRQLGRQGVLCGKRYVSVLVVPAPSVCDGNVYALRPEEILGVGWISRADIVRGRLPVKPAGSAQPFWDCARRSLYDEPAIQEDGACAGGMVVPEDGDELLE